MSTALDAAGHITFDGKAHSKIKSFDLIREGLALVPEGRGIFPKLMVVENLEMGAFSRTDGKTAIEANIPAQGEGVSPHWGSGRSLCKKSSRPFESRSVFSNGSRLIRSRLAASGFGA